MKSFKQYLMEVARDEDRAAYLLNYLHMKRYVQDRNSLGDQMHNLLPPIKSRPDIGMDAFRGRDYRYKPEVRDIPTDSMVSNQHHVSAEIVEKKIYGKIKEHVPEIPWAIHENGKHIILDGNHRANEAKLMGRKTMKALVVDARGDEPRIEYKQRRNSPANRKPIDTSVKT